MLCGKSIPVAVSNYMHQYLPHQNLLATRQSSCVTARGLPTVAYHSLRVTARGGGGGVRTGRIWGQYGVGRGYRTGMGRGYRTGMGRGYGDGYRVGVLTTSGRELVVRWHRIGLSHEICGDIGFILQRR